MAGEADETDFAALLRFADSFHTAARSEDAVGVVHADVFMELEKIEVVGLEAAEGFVELLCGGFFGSAVDFGHEKGTLAVTVAQSFAHADFGVAIVVVPAVVEEIDAAVKRGANDTDGVLLTGIAEVIAAEPDGGHSDAGAPEGAIGNFTLRVASPGEVFGSRGAGGTRDQFEEFATA